MLELPASAQLRDQMLGELNDIGSADEAAKWAYRRYAEKNKLNAADARHIEEIFRTKLLSFAIHENDTSAQAKDDQITRSPTRREQKPKSRSAAQAIDKNVLPHPEPRRVRDREHVRFVAKQPCLVCGRQPADAHHLRFTQSRALGRKVSDEFTVPLCRGHHRELHKQGDEPRWWKKLDIDPCSAARTLWLQTHPSLGELGNRSGDNDTESSIVSPNP